MKNFTYYRPKTAEDAVGLLDNKWGTTELLAGGTDLLDLQKEYIAQPDKVVSLNGLPDFDKIHSIAVGKNDYKPKDKQDDFGRGFRIGAGTKLADIARHEELHKLFPALTTAAGMIGGPQIQNMGTLGGNLCQRNRCWYFRDEHVHCLLKGGNKCFALDGENRYHAVFTQGHKCVIVHPSTLAPVLIALGAKAQVLGPSKGKHWIPLDRFFRAPSSATEREHVLEPNEIVLAVVIPYDVLPGHELLNASYEVRHKQAYDWPLVQAAVAIQRDVKGKTVHGIGNEIVLGHVAPTPLVVPKLRNLLGREITEETATAAGKAAAEGAKPLAQNGYKTKLIEVAVKRAILTAAGHKKYWEA